MKINTREDVLKAIADETRLKILETLDDADSKTFIELKSKFGLLDATLSRHLKALKSTGLVSHIYERNRNQRNPRSYSYYEITTFGRRMLKTIRNTLSREEIKRLIS